MSWRGWDLERRWWSRAAKCVLLPLTAVMAMMPALYLWALRSMVAGLRAGRAGGAPRLESSVDELLSPSDTLWIVVMILLALAAYAAMCRYLTCGARAEGGGVFLRAVRRAVLWEEIAGVAEMPTLALRGAAHFDDGSGWLLVDEAGVDTPRITAEARRRGASLRRAAPPGRLRVEPVSRAIECGWPGWRRAMVVCATALVAASTAAFASAAAWGAFVAVMSGFVACGCTSMFLALSAGSVRVGRTHLHVPTTCRSVRADSLGYLIRAPLRHGIAATAGVTEPASTGILVLDTKRRAAQKMAQLLVADDRGVLGAPPTHAHPPRLGGHCGWLPLAPLLAGWLLDWPALVLTVSWSVPPPLRPSGASRAMDALYPMGVACWVIMLAVAIVPLIIAAMVDRGASLEL